MDSSTDRIDREARLEKALLTSIGRRGHMDKGCRGKQAFHHHQLRKTSKFIFKYRFIFISVHLQVFKYQKSQELSGLWGQAEEERKKEGASLCKMGRNMSLRGI